MKKFTLLVGLYSLIVINVFSQSNSNLKQQKENIIMSDISHSPSFIELGKESVVLATSFKEVMKANCEMTDADDWSLYKTELPDDLGYTLYRYTQTYHGIPVLDGVYLSHTLKGKIVSVNGDFFKGLNVDIHPSLNEAQALEKALQHIGASVYMWANKADEENMKALTGNPDFSYYPKGSLAIVPEDGDHAIGVYKLCYKFDVYAQEPLSKYEIYVDAHTGEVIHKINRIETADVQGTAKTRYSGTQTLTTDQVSTNSFRLRETGRGKGIETYNCQTTKSYSGTDFTDSDNDWNNVNTAHDEVATDAHWGAEKVYDYYKEVHNRNSIDNNGYKLLNYIHYDKNYNNAFWDGQRMTFGDGDGTKFNPLVGLDVLGHEITHGLVSNTAKLGGGEAGALNEGFSDIFGTNIKFYARPSNADWAMGVDISPTGTPIRSLEDPNKYKQPDTYKGTYWDPQGEVHKNDGVVNYWYYLTTMGGSGTNDLGNTYNVTGITIKKAEKIAFRALTVYMTSSSNYTSTRTAAIKAAEDLYGACSFEAINTTNAWYAVGVGDKTTCTNVAVNSIGVNNAFQIFPNPTTETISFIKTANNDNSPFSVEITNAMGERLYQTILENKQGMSAKTINVSFLAPGIYFISMRNDRSIIIKQLVKQ